MKAKITDYFIKNCKDAANRGHLWYAVDDRRDNIMYSMDNISAYIVDYDARLHAIFEAVHAIERGFGETYLVLFQGSTLIEYGPIEKAEKYKYHDHTYLHIVDYMFDYDYIKRKLPKGDITYSVYKINQNSKVAILVFRENSIPCITLISCAYKKVGSYG